MNHILYQVQSNVAILTLQQKNKSNNLITASVFSELKKYIYQANHDDNIQGLIITSGFNHFCYGADVAFIQKLTTTPLSTQYKKIMDMHEVLMVLTEGKPSVCLINGLCLGGGLEIALATQYRIGIMNTQMRLGLPEVKIGLIPGLGGTQRLIRLIGLEHALPTLLKGNNVHEDQALQYQLIDALSKTKKIAITQSIAWIKNPETSRKKHSVNPYRNLQTFSGACALIKKDTQGCYTHVENLIQCIYEGALLPLRLSLECEAHFFLKTLNSKQSQDILKTLFFDRMAIRKHAKSCAKRHAIEHLGIIGGGFMGSAIAAHALANGIPCTVIEQPKRITQVTQTLHACLQNYPPTSAKMKITSDMKQLSKADVVIEAVFENIELKQSILKEAEQYLKKGALLATNTSSIPVGILAQALESPQQFIGIHFFSPVRKMQLVEIISSKKSNIASQQKALALSILLKKTPILVKDIAGFYTTNVAMAYASSALDMLSKGIPAHLIETAARRIGMPTPPLQLLDEIGIDVIHGIIQQQKSLSQKVNPHAEKIITELYTQKRMGRKEKAGFYSYTPSRILWDGIKQWEKLDQSYDIANIEHQLFSAQTNAAKELVETGIIDAASANVGAILGLGFCPWSGGPLQNN
ncbi:3-hydroxyacyl-CoA dehydrogenase NAD-binding domain-containing protein [Candidatus Comchoanobacter bicostacola]|uniref:3-hydroxyacyl-CoA dehydrogenase NAD-binding domain-containing protein n=1 Tax=Candidatus Comchoanobacter bicostacola TaxID=2919598 RepID=A0ABY5DKQ1_9GAMM|nr:3-hydroxyacyl-CoA dehydrogenase NAD-binding domain-containing protein [Candidatus Comchoanobacter bicostacola]UTC24831.1 3-hydroxyacyl-CoA dehydrogenase NAD-binding domain-containing protein [Candidatus Comchoanobacter bicostacola]